MILGFHSVSFFRGTWRIHSHLVQLLLHLHLAQLGCFFLLEFQSDMDKLPYHSLCFFDCLWGCTYNAGCIICMVILIISVSYSNAWSVVIIFCNDQYSLNIFSKCYSIEIIWIIKTDLRYIGPRTSFFSITILMGMVTYSILWELYFLCILLYVRELSIIKRNMIRIVVITVTFDSAVYRFTYGVWIMFLNLEWYW